MGVFGFVVYIGCQYLGFVSQFFSFVSSLVFDFIWCYSASASYDGKVKLWDLRSSIPLHTISAHSDKALSVAFHPNAAGVSTCLVSGGADKQLQVHNIATSS
jgi:WD40 repeat protein